jgi:hypothetical protein
MHRTPDNITSMAGFGREVWDYVSTLVPYWRLSDEAWSLDSAWPPEPDSHLIGIGVLRNYGGDVIVIPWDENDGRQRSSIRKANELLDPNRLRRVVVIVDDCSTIDLVNVAKKVAPIAVLPWSLRNELSQIVIKDEP